MGIRGAVLASICHVTNNTFSVLGFAPMEFVGMERGENYTVLAGFLSGRGRSEEIDLELRLGTAGKSVWCTLFLFVNRYEDTDF